jgi:hypothetical protein
MKSILAASTAFLLAAASLAHAADAPRVRESGPVGGVRIGVLDCEIGGGLGYVLGSAKEIDCVFNPSRQGVSDNYAGTIRKLGVDVGFTTRGHLVWAVFAPTAGYHAGSLGGRYRGATVEATAGVGVGANVLVGGTTGSVHLQLISVTGQTGLNLAATGTSVTLTASN